MFEYRIKINKNLLATMFIGGEKGVIVFASGLPQYVQKQHSFVSQILKAGYSLCIPKYYGTWESSGRFSVKSSTKALRQTLDLIKKGECKELYDKNIIKWNTNKIILLGYSFGARPALQCDTKDIFATLLICPFISSKLQTNGENISKTLEFIKESYPYVYRFNPKIILNELSNPKLPDKKENLIIIKGLLDKSITDETYEFLTKKYKVKPILENMGHSVNFKESYFN